MKTVAFRVMEIVVNEINYNPKKENKNPGHSEGAYQY